MNEASEDRKHGSGIGRGMLRNGARRLAEEPRLARAALGGALHVVRAQR
jgi:hypothetical protein